MAICTMNPIKTTLDKAISYIANFKKTKNQELITLNNLISLDQAAKEILESENYLSDFARKKKNTLAQHLRQAFKPGEVTPEQAHKIGVELVKKLYGENTKFILTTHIDTKHIHNHIILDHVDINTKKTRNTNIKFYWDFRKASDELCKKYNLHIVEEQTLKTMRENLNSSLKKSNANYIHFIESTANGSYQKKLKLAIDLAIENATGDYQKFLIEMEKMGYSYKDQIANSETQKEYKYLSFKYKTQKRFTRASFKTLGEGYTREDILERLNTSEIETKKPEKTSHSEKIQSEFDKLIFKNEKIINNKGLNIWATKKNINSLSMALDYLSQLKKEGASLNLTTHQEKMKRLQKEFNLLQREKRNITLASMSILKNQFYLDEFNTIKLESHKKDFIAKYGKNIETLSTAKETYNAIAKKYFKNQEINYDTLFKYLENKENSILEDMKKTEQIITNLKQIQTYTSKNKKR